MSAFDLVIFDCDGVLVDSERIANEVFAQILHEECGLCLSLDDMFRVFVGHSSGQCMQIVEQMTGEKPPIHLQHRYQNETQLALESSVTAIQGIEQAISKLPIPYCVASSGSYEKMHTTLGKTHLLPLFEGKLYSTSDVSRGKPYPDIYLHAASNMGVSNPGRCLVIEDSPLGVKGGVAAGMTVFGYCELMDESKLISAGAHRSFNNMAQLPDEIRRYGLTAR
ncbi:MAG: HAD family hydrolase [Gammaproteobacteria bacterium]|nr:HAD family hydrolase [Gammaproteobacteria bacterium]